MTRAQFRNYIRWVMEHGDTVYQRAGEPEKLYYKAPHMDEHEPPVQVYWHGPMQSIALYVGAELFEWLAETQDIKDDYFISDKAFFFFEDVMAKYHHKGWVPWSQQMGLELLLETDESQKAV